jgi:hypothetical protein
MRVRIASVAVGVLTFTVSTLGQADTIRLAPVADGITSDGQPFPFDGVPDRLFETFGNRVAFQPGLGDQRAVMRFDINGVKGLRVLKATLKLLIVHKETAQSTIIPIEVRGYNSNGVLRLSDFYRGTFVAVFDGVAAPFEVPVAINVTERVKSGLASPSGLIGFTLRTNTQGTITFGSIEDGLAAAPKLVISTE